MTGYQSHDDSKPPQESDDPTIEEKTEIPGETGLATDRISCMFFVKLICLEDKLITSCVGGHYSPWFQKLLHIGHGPLKGFLELT